MSTLTRETMVIGGHYNWKHRTERLVYMGSQRYPGDRSEWHQFEKVEEPGVVWCEVNDSALSYFEVTSNQQKGASNG